MKCTNINITGPKGSMPYRCGYDNSTITPCSFKYRMIDNNISTLLAYDPKKYNFIQCVREGNEWTTNYELIDYSEEVNITPNGMSLLNIYFPKFSVDVYNNNILYAVDASIYLYGNTVSLGSYIIKRVDSLIVANDADNDYFEYMTLPILDPFNLIYGDIEEDIEEENWKRFRKTVWDYAWIYRDEGDKPEFIDSNNGSNLIVSIHPVMETSPGVYQESTEYLGSQTVLNISKESSDYFKLKISDNHKDIATGFNYMEDVVINMNVEYNESYAKTDKGLLGFLKDAYNIPTKDSNVIDLKLEVVVQDNDDIYAHDIRNIDLNVQKGRSVKPSRLQWDVINIKQIWDVGSWEGFKEGIFIKCFLHISERDKRMPAEHWNINLDKDNIYLASNKIPVTQELYSYLINDGYNAIRINELDMNISDINVVNKIKQEIIQIDRPDDYKANLIKPVFFRVHELGNIVLHPEVTEQICINLDAYKSKVDYFVIKIEGITFAEIATTSAGTIFRIIGNNLPGVISNGLYYILDQDGELITTGKYTYER